MKLRKSHSLFLLMMLLIACSEPAVVDEVMIVLSNTSISQTTQAGSLIARVYVPESAETGVLNLSSTDDGAAFRLEGDKLYLETLMGQPQYAITLIWESSSGLKTEQSFILELASESLIVPAERLGGVAFMGQEGADFRALNPSRRLELGAYERYYFDGSGYQVEVCKVTDSVTAVMVNEQHEAARGLVTAEGLSFHSSLAELLGVYGETESIGFSGYTVYVYEYEHGDISFAYLDDQPESVQDISMSQRHCPLSL